MIHARADQPTSRRHGSSSVGLMVGLTRWPLAACANGSREYRQVLSEECDRLAGELAPATVYVTILWRDSEFNDHLLELLRSLDHSLRDSLSPVFVTEAPAACKSIADEFDAPVIEMPLHQFARGIQQVVGEKQLVGTGTIALPSGSGVAIPLEPQTANWIAEEIEMVPLGAPKSEEEDVDTFLRGGTATWTDLERNVDARRDVQTRLTAAVRRDLEDWARHPNQPVPSPRRRRDHGREASRMGTPRRVSMWPAQANHPNGNGRQSCSRSRTDGAAGVIDRRWHRHRRTRTR